MKTKAAERLAAFFVVQNVATIMVVCLLKTYIVRYGKPAICAVISFVFEKSAQKLAFISKLFVSLQSQSRSGEIYRSSSLRKGALFLTRKQW